MIQRDHFRPYVATQMAGESGGGSCAHIGWKILQAASIFSERCLVGLPVIRVIHCLKKKKKFFFKMVEHGKFPLAVEKIF